MSANVFELEGSITLDTSGMKKAVNDAKSESADLVKALQQNAAQIKAMQTQIDSLTKELGEVKKELGQMKSELDRSAKAASEASESTADMKKELDQTDKALDEAADSAADMTDEVKKNKKAMDEASDAADGLGKEEKKTAEKTDDYKSSAKKAKDETGLFEKAAKSLGETAKETGGKIGELAEKLKNALVVAAKAGAAAVTAATTAVTALTKSALDEFSSYEQLVGGVDTLFGESSAKVQEYADEAYKTAGMSANEYMETVTSFSASLLQGLGGDTDKAADIADLAIRDMSDNANKMGTDMQSIQNAYQGFAKQNYSMLDNLKLGYGGTKGEMARLLNYANELDSTILGEGVVVDEKFEDVSFDSMIRAIHLVQEEMGITGTTAAEAADTIQGSAGSVKAAWKNMLTEFGKDNGDISGKLDILIKSAEGWAANVLPRIETIIGGIGEAIEAAAPIIANVLPKVIGDILPSLVRAGISLVSALANAVVKNLPTIAAAAKKLILSLANGIAKNAPTVISGFTEMLAAAVERLIESLPEFVEAGMEMIVSISEGLVENLPAMMNSITEILLYIAAALTDNLPILTNNCIQIVGAIGQGIVENLPNLIGAALQIITTLSEYLSESLPEMIPNVVGIILEIVEILTNPANLNALVDAAIAIVLGLADGIINSLPKLVKEMPKIVENVVDGIVDAVPKLLDAAIEIIAKLAMYLTDMDNLRDILESGGKILLVLIQGIGSLLFRLGEIAEAIISEIADNLGISDAYDWGVDLVQNFINGIVGMFDKLTDAATDLGSIVYNILHHSTPEEGPLKDDDEWGGDFVDNFTNGIRERKGSLLAEIMALSKDMSMSFAPVLSAAGSDLTADISGYEHSGSVRLGQITVQNLNIYVNELASDYDTDRMIERISEKLQTLYVSDQRSTGGVGW